MSFFSELRERKVVRMAIVYAVAGWALLQVADITAGVLELPDWTLRFTLAVIVLCFPLALILSWSFRLTPEGFEREAEPSASPDPPSVAVLPFRRQGENPPGAYLADGLAEEVLHALARIDGLRVPSRRSCFRFRDASVDVRKAAAQLHVAYMLEAVIMQRGEELLVSLELTEAKTDSVCWSRRWEGRESTVHDLPAEVACEVARTLNVAGTHAHATADRRAVSPEAYHAWLRGRHAAHRGTADGYREAIACYEQAIELDDGFANTWASLSRAYTWLARYGVLAADRGFSRARESAERALMLDSASAEAHLALGELRLSRGFDFAGARDSFQQARELDPNNAEVYAHLGHLLGMLRHWDEALAARRKAVDLDPLSETAHVGLADTLFLAGRYNEAEHELARVREFAPDYPLHHLQARIALARGDPRGALEHIASERLEWRRLYISAIACHRLGNIAQARESLETFVARYGDSAAFQIAIIYSQFGEFDEAFRWLAVALEQRDPGLIELEADPELEALRDDPRYGDILERARFRAAPPASRRNGA